jgi:hypothetical protein
MKNIINILFIISFLLPFTANAQRIKQEKIKIGSDEMDGYTALYKYDKSLVEAAITQKLADAGLKKPRKKKNFYTYKEITLPDICPGKINLYYRVKKNNKRSTIYFLVSKENDNFISPANDSMASENIKKFLSQVDDIAKHNEEIQRQEEKVEKMNQKIEKRKQAVKKAEEKKAKESRELNKMKKDE